MLTTGFQLLTEVNDDLLRRLASSETQYRLLAQIGVHSLMVVPLVSRGQIAGIMTFAYTADSNRRYGRDDPPVAEEIALHAAHGFENARLMKDLRAARRGSASRSRAPRRRCTSRTDRSLRLVLQPARVEELLGKTDEQQLPPEEAAQLMKAKRRVLEAGEALHAEMDLTFDHGSGAGERRHVREACEPVGMTPAGSWASSGPRPTSPAGTHQPPARRRAGFPRTNDGDPGPRPAQSAQRRAADGGHPPAGPRADGGDPWPAAAAPARRWPDGGADRYPARRHAGPLMGKLPGRACPPISARLPGPRSTRCGPPVRSTRSRSRCTAIRAGSGIPPGCCRRSRTW